MPTAFRHAALGAQNPGSRIARRIISSANRNAVPSISAKPRWVWFWWLTVIERCVPPPLYRVHELRFDPINHLCRPVFEHLSRRSSERGRRNYGARGKASSAYWDQKRIAQREYRKRISELILKADKIEVFLLDFFMPETEESPVTGIEAFPMVPYQTETRIIKKSGDSTG